MSDIDNLIRKYNNGLSIEDLKPKEPEQPEMPSMAESFGKNAFNNVEALYSGLLNFAGTMQANSDDPYNQLRGEYMRQGADWLEKDMQQRAATMPQKNFGGFFDAVTNPDYYTNPLGLAADLGQSFGSFVGMFPMTVFTPEIAMPAQMARAGAQLFGKMGASKLASAASKYYMNKLAQDAVENTIAKSGIEKAIETFGKERVAATLKNPIQSAVGNSFNWAAKSFLPDAASNAGSMRSDMEENGITDTGEQWNRMVGEFATEAPADFLSEYLEGAILGGKLGRAIGGPNAGRVRRAAQNLLIGAPVNMANEGLQEGAQQVSTNYWSGGDDLMEGVPESIRAGAFGGAGPSFVGSVNQLMTATPHEGKGTTQDNTPTNKETTNVQEYAEEQGDNTEDSAKTTQDNASNIGGNSNAKAIYDVFHEAGYSDAYISGILGRVELENNFDTSDVPETDTEDGLHVGGYGMFQWNGGRAQNFTNWAKENGLDPQDAYTQAKYALLEAQERGLTPDAVNNMTPREAARSWTDKFEVGMSSDEENNADAWAQRISNGDMGIGTSTDADDAFAWLNSRTPDDFDDYDEATQTSETFNRVQREFGDIFGKQKDGHETIKPGQEETFNELYNKYKTDIDSYKEEQRAQGLTAPQGTAPQPRDVGVAPTIETSETPAIDRAKPVVKTKAEAEQSGMTTEIKGNPIQPYLPNRPIPMTNPNATGTINAAPIQGAPQYAQNVNRPTNGLLGNITTQAAPAQAQMINNQPVNMQGAPQTGVVNPMAPIVQRQAQPTVSQQMANMGAPVRQMGATVGMPNIVSQNTRPAQPILLLGAGKGNALNDAANMIGGNQNVSTQGNENEAGSEVAPRGESTADKNVNAKPEQAKASENAQDEVIDKALRLYHKGNITADEAMKFMERGKDSPKYAAAVKEIQSAETEKERAKRKQPDDAGTIENAIKEMHRIVSKFRHSAKMKAEDARNKVDKVVADYEKHYEADKNNKYVKALYETQRKAHEAINHIAVDFTRASNPDAAEKIAEVKELRDELKKTPKAEDQPTKESKDKETSRKSERAKGNTVDVLSDNGKEYKARYRLIEVDDVVTSNNPTSFDTNADYPKELQPRDRQRVGLKQQITSMTGNLRPADLAASRNLNQGAPIVYNIDGKNIVLNGNGRSMAIIRALKADHGANKPKSSAGARYRAYLKEHAAEFGIPADAIDKMRDPVLVREITDNLTQEDTQDIIGSTAGGSRMSASEQAQEDAKKITLADLDEYKEGNIDAPANSAFVRGILNRVINTSDMNAYMDRKGNISADGLVRVKRALFALAYGDENLISKMAESVDDEIKNVSTALMNAAPTVARANLLMRNGQRKKMDIAKTITDAIKKYEHLKKTNMPVQGYLDSTSLFDDISDASKDILAFLDRNKRKVRAIADMMKNLATNIINSDNPQEGSLFGGAAVKNPTLKDYVETAIKQAEIRDNPNEGILSFGAPQETTKSEKQETALSEKAENKGETAKEESKPATEQASNSEATTQESEAQEDNSIFGSVEDADKELFETLGINPDEDEKKLTAPEGITNTAEERAKLEAELMKELNKISANPVFNPKIYELGVRLAMTYVKDGINTIKKLIAKLNATFGDKIGPWAPAIAETVSTWPKGVKFDEKAVRAISKAIGARYERGIRTREAMHEDMKKSLKGSYETFAPMIDAAYNGIEKFFNQEAEGNGNRSEQEQSGRRGQANAGEHSGGTEEVQGGTENRGETIPERPREGNGSDTTVERPKAENGSTAKENGNTQGVRSGLSGEKGRQTDESTESRNDGDGREGGGQSGASPMGRGGRRAGGNDNRPGGTGSTGNADVVKENYHMDNPDALLGGTPKVRFARNKKAIETIQDIMATHRGPTQEEKEAMAAFTGWGSFGQELFQGTYDNPKPKAGWEKESEWLRDTLGKEEWESAQKSILNAHYTAPPIVTAMWDMVKRMGFNGGRVLEPSMGVGNFFALMPKGMERVSKLFGIEMDTMTGKMAQALYPQANIQIKPYQDSHVADGTYDLIISNVPFANFSPADRRYDKYKATLHDYFYLKGIDELRAGGIMIAITSNGTMDKANRATRIALAKKAELVGAYRLPTGAFKEYAGTNVVTDILVFKKRESPLLDVSNEEWLGTTEHQGNERDENGDYYKYRVNNYFENHPDHVLGNMGFGHGTTTGRPGLVVTMDANKYEQQIADMVKSIPQNIYEEPHYDKNLKYESNNANDRLGTLQVINGKLYVANGTESKPRELYKDWQFSSSLKNPETIKARLQELKDLVTLRLAYNKLEDAEKNDAPDLEKLRKELKKVYDAHVAKYCMDKNGKPKIVHYTAYDDDGNKVRKTRPMILEDTNGLKMFEKAGEPNYASLCALQRKDGKPADILLHRVMRQGTKDIKNPSVSEALMIQRNQSMIINVDKIAEMAHKSKDEVLKELGDKLFKTPTGEYQVRDQYLSGNVRRKLREAQEALNNGDTSMKRNIEALKEVMPEDIPYYNISANMGATWVGLPYYKEFIQHLLGATGIEDKIDVGQDVTGSWTVSILDPSLKKSAAATSTYGTSDVPFDRLLTHAFNHTSPTITYKDDKGTTHKDEQAMERAKEKINTIRSEFENWIWADEKRKIDLSHNYNETLNCTAIPQYDGSFLDMKGMMLTRGDKPFNLRQHQINAIYRGLVNGSGIYAHEVGTGKTYTMGGLAIESRRFGLAKKPLILAHNANSATVAKEIQEMYPGAKILYISGDSKTALRDLMRAKVDDWDVIVLPHSKTNLLTLKSETLEALAEDIIAQLEDDAREAAKIDGIGSIDIISVEDSLEMDHDDIVKQIGHIRSQTAKQLLLQRLKLIETIKKNAYNASKEGAIPFEDLGIDMIIVDESHDYKKPPFSTKMKVKGLQKGTSSMSIQLDFLSQYVQSQNNGRGVHLFTGTPITNTITEVYHNMKYVMPQQMKEANIYNFDDWFNTFAVINSEMEYTATGDVANIERLNSFVNVAELRRMIGQYMDVVFADDMPEFHPRMTPTGKTLMDKDLTPEERDYLIDGRDEAGEGRPYMQTITEVVPMNGAQKEILSMLQRYAKQWENAKPAERKKIMKEQSPQAPLYVESSAHAAAMDARLYNIDAIVDDGDSKEKRLVKNVKQIYDSDERTTQVIMLDTGKSDSAERILRDKLGYPLEEADAETGKIPKEKVKMFNLQKDIIKSLVEAGIPRGEIAEVTGTTNADKKKEIAEQVDKGIIRVVIGSTATLGTGVNMQTNLKAIHHMDAPWMPGELEQRNGRILRQGNKWNTVLQYRYVTEKLDGRRWQVLSTKSKFIKMFMKADDSLRILDGDAVDMSDGEGGGDDIAQTLSEATGDPRFLKKANLEAQLEKLEKQYNIFVAGIDEAKYKLEKLKGGKLDEMRSDVDKLKKMRDNYAAYVENHGKDSYEITIDGKTYTERSQADAAIQKYFKDHSDKIRRYFKVGEFAGLNLYGYRTPLDGGGSKNEFYMTPDDKIIDGFSCLASPGGITSKLGKIESTITKKENELKANENDVKTYEKQVKSTFPRMDILTAKRKEYKALEEDLLNNPVPPPQWLVESAPIGTEVLVDGNKGEVETYRIRIDGDDEKFYYAGVKFEGEKETKFIPWQDVEDTQGLKLINAPTGVKESPEYKWEYENQKTNVVATEGMFDKTTNDGKFEASLEVGALLTNIGYDNLNNLAEKHNGNIEGTRGPYTFETEADRDAFVEEANKVIKGRSEDEKESLRTESDTKVTSDDRNESTTENTQESTQSTASEGTSKYEAPDSRVKIDGNRLYLNLEGVNPSQVRDIGRQIQEIGGTDLKPAGQVEGSDYLIEYNIADESISRAIKKAIDESYPKVAKQESETPSHFTKSMFNGKYAASNDKKVDYQTYKKLNALAVDEHNGRYHKKGGGTFYGFVFDSEADRDAFVKDADNLLNDGKTQFSVSEVQDGEELKQRAIEDVDTEVHKAFNGVEGINYERQADGTFTYSFDVSGRHVDIGVGNNINVGEEQGARAKAEHGIKRNATITVNGVTATREGMASILLSRLSKAAGAIYHEAFHVAYNLFLNEKERAAIEKAFKKAADANGMTIEEYAADRYREWVIAKVKGKHVAFAKLWEKVNNGAQTTVELMDAVTEAAQVFDEIESGRVWKRENGIDNKQAKVYDEIKDEIEAGHLPQTFMQEAREFVADVHAKIDGLQEIPDSTLDQIFFSSKAVKSARSEFNYYLNNNEERAFNASLKFDLLGRLFEHDESVKGFRGANSESVGSTSTQRVYGENDKGEPRDAARGSNQEGESGSGKRVRRSPKVISAIKTNDVKRIHDYYENNKNKYGVNRARNNNRTLGRPDNRGGFSVAENPDADIHFSLAGERGATRLDRHGEHLKRALMEAKRMRKAGATDSEIWEKTGWKWGRDGRPRFEIPDNLDKITLPTKAGTYRLGDIYDNERLYQAYPDFRKMKVTIESPTQEGARIRRGDYGEALPGNIILNKAKFSREPLEVKKTIVHEVQHIIQDREGFATGGSMDDVTDVLINKAAKEIADENITETEADDYISAMFDARDAQRDLKKNNLTKAERDRAQAAVTRAMAKIKKYEATLPKSTVKKAKDAFKRVKDADKYDAYMNLGGEQEAREVEERATNKTSAAPTIHNDDALITFDGTSIAMKQEKTPTLDDAPTKEDIEKQGDNFAKRTMAKALDTVERKMHLKGDNIEVIDAELSGPSSKNLGFIDRYWASPSRIAEKMPAFRPYFEMADKAMMVLKQTRTHFQRRLDNAMKLVKDKSDRENLFEILWQGDAEGKEYTADELREMGASDNVIDAYRGVRSMMEKAYNMLNEARMQYVTHSEHVTEGRLAELRNDKFVKIIRVKDTGDDLLVTYKSRNHWKREYHNLAPEMVELLKQDDNIQVIRAKLEDKTRPEAGYVVTVNESVGNLTKRGGYIPHFFHDYFVKKVDEEGREVTVGSGRTVREAVEAAEAWKANHKLGKMEKLIISPKVYNFGGKSEADYGAIMGDREYKNMVKQIAKNNDMTIKEAKELTEDAVRRTSRHRFFGNFKKRTGAEGFEQDMGWVLRHYFNSAARYYALETEFKPKAISLYERQYGAFDKVPKSDVADYVRDYINDVNGVPSKLEESINRALMSNKFFSRFIASNFGERAGLSVGNKLSNIVSVAKLGVFNVSSAVINLTQITNAAAVLGDVSILWKGIYKGANTHHSIADVRVWQETGVLDETGIDSNGYDKNRAYSMLGRIGNASMFMFTSVEGILRRGTTLAAYEKAIKKGKSHREAIRYAQEVDRKVNFEYGVQDAPNVFRRGSIISQLLLQFKKYPIKELELMHEMSLFSNKATTKQKLIFWGLYFAMAGLFGIPFSDLPDEILELAGAKARPKMAIKRAIMEWAGDSPFKKMLAQIAIYGVGSQAGIDISSRAGIGDIMPTSLKDFSGATISTLIDVIGAAASADPVKAITALSPGAGNIIKAYTGESIGKRGRVNTKYDTAHDRICRLLGFRSLGEAVDSDVTYMRSLEKSEKTSERQEAIDAYIENPTNENAKKLKELGVKRRDVEKEREKKRLSRQERTTGNMKKGERDAYTTLYNFAK